MINRCKKNSEKKILTFPPSYSFSGCFLSHPFSHHTPQDIRNFWRSSWSETSESIKASCFPPLTPTPYFRLLSSFACPFTFSSLIFSPTSGFLTRSQSLKKFFFEARPLESNINQITPSSRTPLALPPLHSCYSSFFPVDSLAVLSSAYRLR